MAAAAAKNTAAPEVPGPAEHSLVVRRAFTYDGNEYKPGSLFTCSDLRKLRSLRGAGYLRDPLE